MVKLRVEEIQPSLFTNRGLVECCMGSIFLLSMIWFSRQSTAVSMDSNTVKPPVARVIPRTLEIHGDTRIDPYYWLRDDSRQDPDVLAYLAAENKYLETALGHLAGLRRKLFRELVARIDPDDESVPYRLGNDWYFRRYSGGADYPLYLRHRGAVNGPEQVILDANRLSAGHAFFEIGEWEVSDDGRLLAYAEDTVGRESYSIHFTDLATGDGLADTIRGATGDMAWAADNETLFYIKQDASLRPHQVYRHRLGTEQATDQLVYQEDDIEFTMSLYRSRSGDHIVVDIENTLSTEIRLIPADRPALSPLVFLPREPGHLFDMDAKGGVAFVRSNRGAENFRIVKVPVAGSTDESSWVEVVPHRTDVFIDDFVVFDDYLVIEEIHAGTVKLRVLSHDGSSDYYIGAEEPAYTTAIGVNPNWDTAILRYAYSSLATPETEYDFNMASRQKQFLKQEFAGNDFQRNNYETRRLQAIARDGTAVPVTMLMKKGTTADGTHPLYITGYGAYGATWYPQFDDEYLSLVDRGFVFAVAHVRGGQEFGRRWYEQGRVLNKKNTFTDFIDATRFLVDAGWGHPHKVVGRGRSAGGLLIGAVANMSPETFTVLIAGVPFVDAVTTMLDESIPLTSFEFDEWGNPELKRFYDYIKSYSPYDQVQPQAYPHMLVTAGLWDARVQYWEPAKWVAKLRANKTDGHRLFLYTDMSAGHSGSAGRYKALRDTALEYAFVLDTLEVR